MTPRRPHAGFVLIELVTMLVLVGVIGSFAGFFLWSGINGYLASKRNSETALSAQVALDRISYELRHIASLSGNPALNTSIGYVSTLPDLTGVRRLSYDSQTIYFSKDGGSYREPAAEERRRVQALPGFGQPGQRRRQQPRSLGHPRGLQRGRCRDAVRRQDIPAGHDRQPSIRRLPVR